MKSRLTYKAGDIPANREALDNASKAIRKANQHFRYAIDGMLLTHEEYIAWRDNGGAAGSR